MQGVTEKDGQQHGYDEKECAGNVQQGKIDLERNAFVEGEGGQCCGDDAFDHTVLDGCLSAARRDSRRKRPHI